MESEMNQRLLHTPEGVRDIYNGECENLRTGICEEVKNSKYIITAVSFIWI